MNKSSWMLILVPAGLLLIAFGVDLIKLVQLSLGSELFSYIPLVPVISAYLIWKERKTFSPRLETNLVIPGLLGLAGVGAFILSWVAARRGWEPAADVLSVRIFSFVCFVTACGFFVGGVAN